MSAPRMTARVDVKFRPGRITVARTADGQEWATVYSPGKAPFVGLFGPEEQIVFTSTFSAAVAVADRLARRVRAATWPGGFQ